MEVYSNDPDVEETEGQYECLYKNKPFTGTLYHIETTPRSYEEYKNGILHGRSVEYYPNGQILEDALYKDGEIIKFRTWHQNGQVSFNYTSKIHWDEDGKIAFDGGSWLYKNGKVRVGYDSDKNTLIYSKDGKVAIKKIYNNDNYSRHFIYYHSVLCNSYKEILNHEYLCDDFNSSYRERTYHNVIGWIHVLNIWGYKNEALKYLNKIIEDAKNNLKNNLTSGVKSIEKLKVDNLTILLKQLENGEREVYNIIEAKKNSKIIF